MEREPEEDHNAENREQGVHPLLDLLCHGGLLLGGVAGIGGGCLLGRSREFLLVGKEYHKRDHHGHDGGDEGIVDTGVEHVQIVCAELSDGLTALCKDSRIGTGLGCLVEEVLRGGAVADELMAESREL